MGVNYGTWANINASTVCKYWRQALRRVWKSRMLSCIGRNAQFYCERIHLHAVLRHFSFDDVLANSRPTNDISLSYANVISELDLVRDDMLSFTDSQFLLLMHVV